MAANIPVIPDDAPFTPEQRDWLRVYLAELVGGITPMGPLGTEQKSIGPRVVVMYGSQSGNAQALSEGFGERLRSEGYAADVVDMTDFESVDLVQERALLIVTSTWGEGDPPDNAIGFLEKVKSSSKRRLEQLNFSVLALGDTNYADFCETGKVFDARFEELGAKRFAPRVDCDVDFEEPSEEWFSAVLANIGELDLSGAPAAIVNQTGGTDVVDKKTEGWSRKNPFPATIIANRRLNSEGALKDTRHLEFSLKGSGMSYEVGDVLGVFPKNDPVLVDEMLSLLPFNTKISVEGPEGRKLTVREALTEAYDIRTINRGLLKKWSELTCHPYLHSMVEGATDEELDALIEGREVIDLLWEFPADFNSAKDFFGILRKLNPRLYSIASSINKHPEEVHLTVAKVEYETHGRQRKGVASTFLCDRVEADDTVGVYLQGAKHFKLPTNGDVDIIMVGPGTGIAPFRAFLEERSVSEASGRNWLFFGNPFEKTDYFYKEELEELQAEAKLTHLDVAWSRDQEQKVYVQNKMLDQGGELWRWLERGAHFYVCGDATYMAGDVDKALHSIIANHGKLSESEAAEFVSEMKKDHRYQRDVY